MDEDEFCKAARESFGAAPDFAHINEEEGVHMVMGAISSLVRTSLRQGDLAMASKALNFVEQAIRNPQSETEIENAAWISFLQIGEFEPGGEFERHHEVLPEKIAECLVRARGL